MVNISSLDVIKMDFSSITSRDDIFKMGITASMLVSLSNTLTDEDRENIRINMGDIWIPYTHGEDSVTLDVLKMPFYNFLILYGDQGDIQGVKKYCSHNIDILNRDYNVLIGKMFISRYGADDPISKIVKLFIYDRTYYKIDDYGVIHYNTTRGERYKLIPRVDDSIKLISSYNPRRTRRCANGDIILKTGFAFFYNCVPLIYYEEYDDLIHIMDIDGTLHELLLDENGIIMSGYEDLPMQYRLRNDSIMDVYDIYRLLKLGMKGDILIRDYGMNYRVIRFLESIDSIVVWQGHTIVTYKNGYINKDVGTDSIIHFDEYSYSIDYDNRTIGYVYENFINFDPITYNEPMHINGYGVIINDEDNVQIIGKTLAY